MLERWRAGAVHAFTGLGAVCALGATLAVLEQGWERVFAWLGVAFIIDGIDGTFARAAKVKTVLPRFSGERIDLVVDYATYVFVPVLALRQAGFLPGTLGLVLAAAILLSSLYHFSDEDSKSEDNCFVGFPAVWNIVAFYCFALALPIPLTALLIVACVALTFVPWRWVHPMRVVRFRVLTLGLTVSWLAAALWVVAKGFPREFPGSIPAAAVLIAVAAYGVGLSLMWRRAESSQ